MKYRSIIGGSDGPRNDTDEIEFRWSRYLAVLALAAVAAAALGFLIGVIIGQVI